MTGEERRLAVAACVASLSGPQRSAALDALAADGPLDPTMAAWALDATLAAFDPDSLARMAAAHPYDRECVAVLLAETVPTAPLRAIALPLLWGARGLHIRAPRTTPRFTALIVATLQEIAPALEITLHDSAGPDFTSSLPTLGVNRLIAFGSDENLTRVASMLAARVVLEPHGHGFGIAILSGDALDDVAISDALALDIAAYEQRGCLSPQCVFVQSADARPAGIALDQALSRIAQRLPIAPIASDELLALRSWRGALGAASVAFHGRDTHAVAVLGDTRLAASAGHRHIGIVPFTNPEQLARVLAPHEPHLTVIASDPRAARWPLAPDARRVTPGRMQCPPLDGWEDPRPPTLTRR